MGSLNNQARLVAKTLLYQFYKSRWAKPPSLRPPTGRATSVLVSLTTTAYRLHSVRETIYSLLNQTMPPEKIILWLGDGSFGHDQGFNPKEPIPPLDEIVRRHPMFSYRFYENIGPHKKLLPSLRHFPNHDIITVDDDFLYAPDCIAELVCASQEFPRAVICHRAREISFTGRVLRPYAEWPLRGQEYLGLWALPVGGDGVLYPRSLREEYSRLLINEERAVAQCPFADDIWNRNALLTQGVQVFKIGHRKARNFDAGFLTSREMWSENMSGRNDLTLQYFAESWGKLVPLSD